jgi:hypothetical protein
MIVFLLIKEEKAMLVPYSYAYKVHRKKQNLIDMPIHVQVLSEVLILYA